MTFFRRITKFNFNGLFLQVWLKSLIQGNVIAGFKTCGIYPFNCNAFTAVPTHDSSEMVAGNVEKTNVEAAEASCVKNSQSSNNILNGTKEMFAKENDVVFSPDQEQLFARRFEEGYDLSTNPAYNRWLKENHPEEIPAKEDDVVFSPDQEQLFARQFEEHYDLSTDPAYNQWLKKNYPESLIMNQSLFADFDEPVVSTSSH